MQNYAAKRVINGTYGELWIDSELVAEVTSFSAKVTFSKSDINQVGKLMTGNKVTAAKGTGTIKLNKVTTRFAPLYDGVISKGQIPEFTLISSLDDPDSFGNERVKITGVSFDEYTLADWEAGKPGEESIPFTFTNYKFLNKIKK